MTTLATQRTKSTKPDLAPAIHPYRIMLGDRIIGQFSNAKLADWTLHDYPRAIVLYMSVQPPMVVYKDGNWLEKVE